MNVWLGLFLLLTVLTLFVGTLLAIFTLPQPKWTTDEFSTPVDMDDVLRGHGCDV